MRLTEPPFDAAYAPISRQVMNACVEAVTTIEPGRPAPRMCRIASREQ